MVASFARQGPHVFSGSDSESPKLPERALSDIASNSSAELSYLRCPHQLNRQKVGYAIADFEPHPTTSGHPPQIVAVQSTCIERRTLV